MKCSHQTNFSTTHRLSEARYNESTALQFNMLVSSLLFSARAFCLHQCLIPFFKLEIQIKNHLSTKKKKIKFTFIKCRSREKIYFWWIIKTLKIINRSWRNSATKRECDKWLGCCSLTNGKKKSVVAKVKKKYLEDINCCYCVLNFHASSFFDNGRIICLKMFFKKTSLKKELT